nr:MAG TPA: hypothetical protein [Caudoviricetes sp.]
MSVLFTDTMTVYNYHRDPETDKETWIRSVVRGVQWSHNRTEVTSSGGVQTESKVESITVDFQRGYGNKPYLEPQKFRKLSAEEAAGYWTLDVRTDQDKLVLGEAEKELGGSYRLSDLKEDFQYAVTVTAVSDNRSRPRLKNIKVVGR